MMKSTSEINIKTDKASRLGRHCAGCLRYRAASQFYDHDVGGYRCHDFCAECVDAFTAADDEDRRAGLLPPQATHYFYLFFNLGRSRGFP